MLEDSQPSIWRQIQVPENYSFWELHVAIQNAMGWYDCHLHQFEITDPHYHEPVTIGKPDNEIGESILIEWETKIADYFSSKNKNALYIYDFGDHWCHQITLEKVLAAVAGQTYPRCIAGERACPPEDCGGIDGYHDLIDIMNDPKHEEYEHMLEWLGGELEPEQFNAEDVHFENPAKRLKEATKIGMI
jgi:hypothetical protein